MYSSILQSSRLDTRLLYWSRRSLIDVVLIASVATQNAMRPAAKPREACLVDERGALLCWSGRSAPDLCGLPGCKQRSE